MPDAMEKTVIEILTFDGCPNRSTAIELVADLVAQVGVDADVRVVDVPDLESAQRMRFLGSPTIRVDGKDIEPGADDRTDYVHGCRIFRTEAGLGGRPSERWLVDALTSRAAGGAS